MAASTTRTRNITRRTFNAMMTAGVASALGANAANDARARIKAIAFDAFVLFDSSNVRSRLQRVFPEKANAIFSDWRTRQFEYSWLRALSGNYSDFWQITAQALSWAAKSSGIKLLDDQQNALMHEYLQMSLWPDVAPALKELKAMGLRLSVLSNLSPMMLDENLKHTGTQGQFVEVISTDQAHTFKPARLGYQLGIDRLRLSKREILFVASAGWDAAGAKQFGYPTFWVNRIGLPMEELDAAPNAASPKMSDLVGFARSLA
jgi:2-haloacid dehalogenase